MPTNAEFGCDLPVVDTSAGLHHTTFIHEQFFSPGSLTTGSFCTKARDESHLGGAKRLDYAAMFKDAEGTLFSSNALMNSYFYANVPKTAGIYKNTKIIEGLFR